MFFAMLLKKIFSDYVYKIAGGDWWDVLDHLSWKSTLEDFFGVGRGVGNEHQSV